MAALSIASLLSGRKGGSSLRVVSPIFRHVLSLWQAKSKRELDAKAICLGQREKQLSHDYRETFGRDLSVL